MLAGDVSPIDVISHLPVLCEDNKVPYCYVPSRMVCEFHQFSFSNHLFSVFTVCYAVASRGSFKTLKRKGYQSGVLVLPLSVILPRDSFCQDLLKVGESPDSA